MFELFSLHPLIGRDAEGGGESLKAGREAESARVTGNPDIVQLVDLTLTQRAHHTEQGGIVREV